VSPMDTQRSVLSAHSSNEFDEHGKGLGNCSLGCQCAKPPSGQMRSEIREAMNLLYP